MDLLRTIKILSDLTNAYSADLKLIELVATLPLTTASNKWFFSTLKWVKEYLGATMGNDRPSKLMIMAVEKEETPTWDELVDDLSK